MPTTISPNSASAVLSENNTQAASLELQLIQEHLETCIELNLLGSLRQLFPDGHAEKEIYHIGKFQVDLQTHHWTSSDVEPRRFMTHLEWLTSIHAPSYSTPSGSLTELYAKHYGLTLPQALKKICARLKVKYSPRSWLMQNGQPGCTEEFAVTGETSDNIADHTTFTAHGYTRTADMPFKNPNGTTRNITRIYSLGDTRWHVSLTPYRCQADGRLFWAHGYPSQPIPLHMDTIAHSDDELLIAPDESTLLYLKNQHRGLVDSRIITTWPGGHPEGIAKVDWSHLRGKTVVVLPECSKHGFSKTGELIKTLQKSGARNITVIGRSHTFEAIQTGEGEGKAFIRDLFHAFVSGTPQVVNEFYRNANDFFGLSLKTTLNLSQVVTGTEFMASPTTEMPWLVSGILRQGERMLVNAPKGKGKTWFVMILYLCIAAGVRIIGGHPSGQGGLKVLVIDGENPVPILKQRLQALIASLELPSSVIGQIDIMSAMHLNTPIDLAKDDVRAAIHPRIAGADVVVMDNVNCLWPDAMTGLPEGSVQLNRYINELGIMGKTVILVNHTPKTGQGTFGSSTKEFGMDVRVNLSSNEHDSEFAFTAKIRTRSGGPVEDVCVVLKNEANGKIHLDIRGGQRSSSRKETHPEPTAEAEYRDNAASTSDTVNTTPAIAQVDNIQRTATSAQDSLAVQDKDSSCPESGRDLSKDMQLVLSLHSQGFTTCRAIETETKRLQNAGTADIKRMPKSRAAHLLRELKKLGVVSA